MDNEIHTDTRSMKYVMDLIAIQETRQLQEAQPAKSVQHPEIEE